MSYENDDFEAYKAKVINFMKKTDGNGSGPKGLSNANHLIWLAILAVLILLTISNSFYTVQPDEEGVVTRFGRYSTTVQPGLHFKLPWIDEIYKVQSKRRQEEVFGFRKRPYRP